ncbi:PiggyBac transposable element-derived protein 4 [Merluccius polli]|uniref:PiggyBac transposable element-derived protein 4 n=1 Tax=Merluccius polli TaxID=89951 RepID=A0AA47MQH2_MERPO|nr:PiggyBac transposable element-derived protein 4 [Merluccius polli]
MLRFSNSCVKTQTRKFLWTEITAEEMKKFIGMLMYMSVLDLPRMSDFWRRESIFSVPFPATAMSRDQFMAILANLHMSDPAKSAENDQKKGTDDYDHLHRVRPLMEMIQLNCKAIYHPRQHLAVDERMWGLKFFVLAATNGYTIDFKLYTGKSKTASGKGLSFDVVAGLIDKGNLGFGYIVYTDNFYTSPLLYRHLRQQGFGACRTYRQGRVGVPTIQENALTKKISTRQYPVDQGQGSSVREVDGHKRSHSVLHHPPSLQRGQCSGGRRQVMGHTN